jgi:hypothetical protein
MIKLLEILKSNWQQYGLITFLSTTISSLVAYNTADRDKSLVEMEAYNKYVTELVVLHKNPENRLKVAQYFAEVSPSWFTRRQWRNYVSVVTSEKIAFDLKNDSLTKLKIAFEEMKRSKALSVKDSIKAANVETELQNQIDIKNEKFQSSSNEILVNTNKAIYIQSSGGSLSKAKELASKLREIGYVVPSVENMNNAIGKKIDIKETQVRFFNEADRQQAHSIYALAKELDSEAQIIYNPKYSNSKNLEIWIK